MHSPGTRVASQRARVAADYDFRASGRVAGGAPTEVVHILGLVLVFWWGVDKLPPWTRTPVRTGSRPGLRPGSQPGLARWRQRWRGWLPRTWTGCPTPPWPNRSWSWGAGGLPGGPVAQEAGRRGRPRGRRGRAGDPGGLDRRVAAAAATDGRRGGQQHGADRSGLFPRPLDPDRPGPGRRGIVASSCPGAGRWHPRPGRSPRRCG